MTTSITVDLDDAVPPYEQIRRQIASLIAIGELGPGDRLPTVRALAADLGVAVGTVSRAYKELESSGVLQSRRRLGTVVAPSPPPPGGTSPAVRDGEAPGGYPDLEAAVETLVTAARQTPFDDETVVDLVRGRLMRARAPRGTS
ncbi:GntR family transcriptional regulator [Arthrobacter sp. JSM 101049]|uniref:GntR family transcriptional regulator n=1 Tax=Arthrobacter sp. JSM 101049 TaxID=929097 RepID=UPI003569F6B1